MASGRSALVASILLSFIAVSFAFNITTILDGFPNFSELNKLLSSSGVSEEINARNSLTLLVVSNDVLTAFTASNPSVDSVKLGDLLRYHVLLQYFGLDDLKALKTDNYTSVSTLYQTTGKANGEDGFLNIYNLPSGILIGPSVPGSSSNASVATNITAQPFDISVIQINSILTPVGWNSASGDLIKILESFNEYTLFINYLKQSGIDQIFAGKETGAGITVFAPKDSAFNKLSTAKLQALSVTELKLLMQYHGLTSYQSLDVLETMVVETPVTTIASTVAAGYKLNVSASDKTVSLHTGVNDATILETLYDARPSTMFAIDAVLLPAELFQADALAPSPDLAPPPPKKAKTPGAAPDAAPDLPTGSHATVATISIAVTIVAVSVSSYMTLF